MPIHKLQKHFASSIILTLITLSIGTVISLFAYQKWDLEHSLRSQQKVNLADYGRLLIQQIQTSELTSPDLLIIRLAHIENLLDACLFVDSKLIANLAKDSNTLCDMNSTSHAKRIALPFTLNSNQSGLLALYYRSARSSSIFFEVTSICIFFILGLSLWLGSQMYFRRVQTQFGVAGVEELESFCKEIFHLHNYKQRADTQLTAPFLQIALTINSMLDELQQNEIQIQENAVLIQEKNDQLSSQQKLHLDRTQNLQKMFAGASHDLRQPLQAMTIFIAAIKDISTQEQAPLISKLEQVLDNLNHLFTDLLDISKLESRMQRIPKSTIDINPLLKKIFDEFEALANEKNIQLRLRPQHLQVYSNPNMLERIIRNMISNAIRYTRTGGVLIGSRDRGQEIWIEVWDTGKGIPTNKMNEIFNEFVQIKDADQEPNKGVGLGLFIVKKLAQLLDHRIIVKSKLRKGTLFRVAVPKHNRFIQKALPPAQVTSPILPKNNQSLSVVLIDDDENVRESLKALIQNWNIHVFDFADAASAIQYIDSQAITFNLIVSDLQLANNQTGITAIRLLREQQAAPIPAVIVTGTTDQGLIKSIEDEGIPYLRKPVKPAKLRALITVLVG